MLRTILMLLIGVIGIALVRNIIREITRFALRSMNARTGKARDGQKDRVPKGGRLVRDPQTGTYIDPEHAVRAKVDGTQHFFESEASRDAFIKAHA